jgi:hypothetical protein
MTTDTLEERRRYIAEIKNSFQNQGTQNMPCVSKYRDVGFSESNTEEKKPSGFLVRAMFAILLFIGFIACDRGSLATQKESFDLVYAMIEEEGFELEPVVSAMKNIFAPAPTNQPNTENPSTADGEPSADEPKAEN